MIVKISIIVPTYKRPDYLVKCLRSLVHQIRKPDEVLVVMRDTDIKTHEDYREFAKSSVTGAPELVSCFVKEPGHMPPLVEGLKHATGDIVAITDDDAEPYPDWLQRVEKHYEQASVGGVGGRIENIIDGKKVNYRPAKTVGKVTWYGRAIGNMYKDALFSEPVEVDFFMGGNTSFRRIVWDQITFDMNLNPHVAYNYEIDIGLQAKSQGWRLIFDPFVIVKHYLSGPRDAAWEGIYFGCRNLTYIMLKHLRWYGKLVFLLHAFLIGHRQLWGLATIILDPILTGKIRWRGQVLAALRGKMAGIRIYLQASRGCDE